MIGLNSTTWHFLNHVFFQILNLLILDYACIVLEQHA